MGTIEHMGDKENQPEKKLKKIVMPQSGGPSSGQRGDQRGPQSGMGMDRKVTPNTSRFALLQQHWQKLAAGAFILFIGWYGLSSMGERSLTIAENQIVISEVGEGLFEDFISLRAQVEPLSTVYLDAIQGGRVEEILIEDGATMIPGQPILRLSNSDLQLNVMGTESRIMEQLNAMRDQELRLEQNRLSHKRNLVEIEYNIKRLTLELQRKQELFAQGHVSDAEFENLKNELEVYTKRLGITLESQESDERLMASQLQFFQEKSVQLEANLAFARKSLDDLNVLAPVGGKLSGFDLEIGQSITRGERLGQIDDPANFKLSALIDEFYLNRVTIGQAANFDRGNDQFTLRISKIYPRVENGQFRVDLQFVDDAPDGIRRGQTLQSRLSLGDDTDAILIPNGTFYQDTGGQWIFVVTEGGDEAVRRNVRLGRRNSRFIEVLEGLQPGERVITSPYSSYMDMDRLNLNK